MDPDHQRIMNELQDEHKIARSTVGGLVESKTMWVNWDMGAISQVRENLSKLVELCPPHILKEDRMFFQQTMKYFSKEELNALLQESYEFDRKMIHEKYGKVIESLS